MIFRRAFHPSHLLPHVDHRSDAVPGLHRLERVIDAREGLAVGDEFVNLELALQIVVDEARELGATLDAAEG